MGFAKKAEDYEDKERQLDEWMYNTGDGILGGWCFEEIPVECVQFCIDQFARFKIPFTPEMESIIHVGGARAFYLLDVYDPYAMFFGISDVNVTDDWANVTYKIFDIRGGSTSSHEPNPHEVESFVFMPGQAEETFRNLIARPGIDALNDTHGHGDLLREILFDPDWHPHPLTMIKAEARAALEFHCQVPTEDGTIKINDTRMNAYFELAAWASYVWLIGPHSRSYRCYHHEIIGTAVTDGECILSSGMIISPKYYTKIDRPPLSCHKCGVQTWCVEHTQIMTHSAYICEACLNFDMPLSRFSNCGTKFCHFSICPNHPNYAYGMEGRYMTYRQQGQLIAMARNEMVTQVMGAPDKKLLGSPRF